MLDSVFQGFSSALMCYGQTGTGKTYTLCSGIIPRAVRDLFSMIADRNVMVSMQMLQLYRDNVYDLLDENSVPTVASRMDIHYNEVEACVEVPSLRTTVVENEEQFMEVFRGGMTRRVTCYTKMNSTSSRSHAVVIVHIEAVDGENTTKGKMLFIDLAGYERMTKTDITDGIRKDEAKTINGSLLALGHVISSLSSRTAHIPWRNSKLTRLLQDVVGGRSKTSIILTIGPSSDHFHETIGTLYFGSRAMTVTTSAKASTEVDYEQLAKRFQEMYANASDRLQAMEAQKMSADMELKEVRHAMTAEVEGMRERLRAVAVGMVERGEPKERITEFLNTGEKECELVLEQQMEECLYLQETRREESCLLNEVTERKERDEYKEEIQRLSARVDALEEENLSLRTAQQGGVASPRGSSQAALERLRQTQHIQRLYIDNERLQGIASILSELHEESMAIALVLLQETTEDRDTMSTVMSPARKSSSNTTPNLSSLVPPQPVPQGPPETVAETYSRTFAALQKHLIQHPASRKSARRSHGVVKSSRADSIRTESEKWTTDDLSDYRSFLAHNIYVLGPPNAGKTSVIYCLTNKAPTIKRLPTVVTPTLKSESIDYTHGQLPAAAAFFTRFSSVRNLLPKSVIRITEAPAEHIARWTSDHMPTAGVAFFIVYNMFPVQHVEDEESEVERYVATIMRHLVTLYDPAVCASIPVVLLGTHAEEGRGADLSEEDHLLETQRRLRSLREWFKQQASFGQSMHLLENVALSCKEWTVVGERAASPTSFGALLGLVSDTMTRSATLSPASFHNGGDASIEAFWTQWLATPPMKRTSSQQLTYGVVTLFTSLRRWLLGSDENVIDKRYLSKLVALHIPTVEPHEAIFAELARRKIIGPLGPLTQNGLDPSQRVVALEGRLGTSLRSALLFPRCTRRALRDAYADTEIAVKRVTDATQSESFHIDQQGEDDMQLWVTGIVTTSAAATTLHALAATFNFDMEMVFRAMVATDLAPSMAFPFVVPMLCEIRLGINAFKYVSHMLSLYGNGNVGKFDMSAATVKGIMAPLQVLLLRGGLLSAQSPLLWADAAWIHHGSTMCVLYLSTKDESCLYLHLASPRDELDSAMVEDEIRQTVYDALLTVTREVQCGVRVMPFAALKDVGFGQRKTPWGAEDEERFRDHLPSVVAREEQENGNQHRNLARRFVNEKTRDWAVNSTVFEDVLRTLGQ